MLSPPEVVGPSVVGEFPSSVVDAGAEEPDDPPVFGMVLLGALKFADHQVPLELAEDDENEFNIVVGCALEDDAGDDEDLGVEVRVGVGVAGIGVGGLE